MITIGKVALVGLGGALLAAQVHGDRSLRTATDTRIEELTGQIQNIRESDQAAMTEVIRQLDILQDRLGETAQGAAKIQQSAANSRKEQLQAIAAIKNTLNAHESAVDTLRQESDAKLDARVGELRDETSKGIGQVQDAVGTVKGDLDVTKGSFNSGLAANKQEIGDLRDQLTTQIARNSQEVAALRRLGERDYFEFDLRNTKDSQRLAAIRLQLNKADVKGRKYDVTLLVDDNKVQKKGAFINEPVQFLVGKDKVRYELVVNAIEKNRIRGYISTPKSSVTSSASLKD